MKPAAEGMHKALAAMQAKCVGSAAHLDQVTALGRRPETAAQSEHSRARMTALGRRLKTTARLGAHKLHQARPVQYMLEVWSRYVSLHRARAFRCMETLANDMVIDTDQQDPSQCQKNTRPPWARPGLFLNGWIMIWPSGFLSCR